MYLFLFAPLKFELSLLSSVVWPVAVWVSGWCRGVDRDTM